jgi:hypothetical protein
VAAVRRAATPHSLLTALAPSVGCRCQSCLRLPHRRRLTPAACCCPGAAADTRPSPTSQLLPPARADKRVAGTQRARAFDDRQHGAHAHEGVSHRLFRVSPSEKKQDWALWGPHQTTIVMEQAEQQLADAAQASANPMVASLIKVVPVVCSQSEWCTPKSLRSKMDLCTHPVIPALQAPSRCGMYSLSASALSRAVLFADKSGSAGAEHSGFDGLQMLFGVVCNLAVPGPGHRVLP